MNIPKHALAHSFLMRGLLAMAALHLHDTNPQPRLLELASSHESAALKEYTTELSAINRENSSALYAFSAMVAATSLAFLRRTASVLSGEAFIGSMSEVFDLLVGAKAVIVEGQQWIKAGDLAPLISPRAVPASVVLLQPQSEMGKGAHASLCVLWEICTELDAGSRPPYMSAIDELQNVFSAVQATNDRPAMSEAIGWPVLVDPRFLDLVKEGDQLALCVLAHYGAVLHSMNNVWFARGLGARLVKAVVQRVDLVWQEKLSWPVAWASVERDCG